MLKRGDQFASLVKPGVQFAPLVKVANAESLENLGEHPHREVSDTAVSALEDGLSKNAQAAKNALANQRAETAKRAAAGATDAAALRALKKSNNAAKAARHPWRILGSRSTQSPRWAPANLAAITNVLKEEDENKPTSGGYRQTKRQQTKRQRTKRQSKRRTAKKHRHR